MARVQKGRYSVESTGFPRTMDGRPKALRPRVFIARSYNGAGVESSQVDTGAVICTGEAVKKNAEAIVRLFAGQGGKFVCATAGPNFEAVLAAHGSGAVARSSGSTIMNADIGGGTCKLAIVKIGIDAEKAEVFTCDLCGGDPKCVLWCPRQAIRYEKAEIVTSFKQREIMETQIARQLIQSRRDFSEKKVALSGYSVSQDQSQDHKGKQEGMYGWVGNLLWVDLGKGIVTKQNLDESFALKWLGGEGFGARLLWELVGPEVKDGLDERDLVTYIESNRDGLCSSKSLLKNRIEAELVLVCSTGTMENNLETVIGRRFKKHGMNWATKGANRGLT